MDLHANAALSWSGRRELARRVLERGWTLTAAARGRRRRRALCSRVGRPLSRRRPAVARPLLMTAAEIAETLDMPLSTVSGILTRSGLGRLGLEPARRDERSRPGELVHLDVKKLGRIVGGAGWRVRGGARHSNRTFTDRNG
jgi:hypothetical protein